METVQSFSAVELLEELVAHHSRPRRFAPEPVPSEVIDTALALARRAPSDCSPPPWRFLVLTEPALRERLLRAARQPQTAAAPVIVVAFGEVGVWRNAADAIVRRRIAATGMDFFTTAHSKHPPTDFIASLSPTVWLNRQVMVAFTVLQLAVEAQGWDTAPLEGFDAAAIRETFALPEDAEVVALLAIGRARSFDPPGSRPLPAREIAFLERYGEPLIPFNESES